MDVLIGKVGRELAALEEQLDRVFERSLSAGIQLPRRGDSFRPTIDVYEADDAVVVRADLAGVRSEDIRLVVDGEFLQISGQRQPGYDPAPVHHLHMEIPQGQFQRVLRLRVPYDPEGVSASFDTGILTVHLPRKKSKARTIPVRSK